MATKVIMSEIIVDFFIVNLLTKYHLYVTRYDIG